MRAMDELEQRCHDLDAKVRRVEEERNAVMMENEELTDKIQAMAQLRASIEEARSDEELKEDLARLSEEVLRLETSVGYLQDNLVGMGDKMKEVSALKETVNNIIEDTTNVKEDFLSLKNHLNIAAKIELQTNEKMYENRLHHLEKMLEEMRHREESFLHIAEETNILKDQVDSLRELSLNTMKSDHVGRQPLRPQHLGYQYGSDGAPTAMAELQHYALHQDLEESPVISEVTSPSSPPIVKFQEVSHQTTSSSNNVIKVTGQVKLTVTDQPRSSGGVSAPSTTLANGTTMVSASVTPNAITVAGMPSGASSVEFISGDADTVVPAASLPTAQAVSTPVITITKAPKENAKAKEAEAGAEKPRGGMLCVDCFTSGFARLWSTCFD